MKRVLRLCGVLWGVAAFLMSSPVASAQDTLALTLDEALQIAESKSLTVRIADKEIRKSGYAKKGTYASLFPQIDFNGSRNREWA